MPKKNSLGGQFSEDIKGFENEYFFLKNLYEEKGWSLSALRSVIKRFVEGWRNDPETTVNNIVRTIREKIEKFLVLYYNKILF